MAEELLALTGTKVVICDKRHYAEMRLVEKSAINFV